MDELQPEIQPYAWGSRTALAQFQGREAPTEGPEAELWMGAHPSAPSGVDRDGGHTTLDAVIAADPGRELGAATAARFGGRLPFLLKVLAAEKALSIQVHPSKAQAERGFREENERGVPVGDPARNYVDDWPKPELLCPLTRFEVLAGFRTPADAATLLGELGVADLEPAAAKLASAEDLSVLMTVLAEILEWPQADRASLVDAAVAACSRIKSEGGRYAPAAAAAVRLSGEHPGNLGIVATLLMRHSVLEPGEALYMPANGLHAYLHGTGIELLANSDNVIRAGLTGKHVDVRELLGITDPAVAVPVLRPRELAGNTEVYDTPAPEFRLYRVGLGPAGQRLPGDGPRLVLSVDGEAELRSASGQALRIGRSESCFISAEDGVVTASGPADLFIAGTGDITS